MNNAADGITCPIILDKLLPDVKGAERHFVLTASRGLYGIGYIKTVLKDGRTVCEPIPNEIDITFEALTAYVDKYMNIDGLTPIVDKRSMSKWRLREFQQRCQALKDESRERST